MHKSINSSHLLSNTSLPHTYRPSPSAVRTPHHTSSEKKAREERKGEWKRQLDTGSKKNGKEWKSKRDVDRLIDTDRDKQRESIREANSPVERCGGKTEQWVLVHGEITGPVPL